jgi:hypothetical protein
MRFAVLQSVICAEVRVASGSTRPAIASLFPTDLRGFSSTPAPVLVKVRVHPLRNFASSSENYSVFIGLPSEDDRTHQHRFCSSSRQQHQESTTDEVPTLRLTFHPQRFSRSRWVTPPSAMWIYFAPQPRAGFALQGFSLPLSRLRLIAGSFPHVVRPVRLPEASSRCQLTARRLQGVYQVTIRCQT